MVRSTTDNRWLEPTTPSARANEASRNLLDRAATPPYPRRGILPTVPVHRFKLRHHGFWGSDSGHDQRFTSPHNRLTRMATELKNQDNADRRANGSGRMYMTPGLS